MHNTIYPNYNQQFLLPPSIENWVPSDHPVRFLREFVDIMDLPKLGFKERKSEDGRPNYSNELLLKIWLYGYFEKIYSTRDLEKACNNQIPLIWLTGLNYPDHNTIWRFFHNNRKLVKEIFKQSIHIANRNGMIGFVLQAIDGTKIYADASKCRSIHKKDLKELLSKLDESLSEIISKIDDIEEHESSKPEYKLPEKLQDKRNLKKLISEGLEELSVEEKKTLRQSVKANIKELEKGETNHLSLTDIECRLMKNKSESDFEYNAQGVVDNMHQIIVGASVTNEEFDNHQMTKMMGESKENTGKTSKETLFDGGYFSGEELAKAEEEGYSVLINLSGKDGTKNEYSKRNFVYNKEKDCYLCPHGCHLTYERTKSNKKKKYRVRVYRCHQYKDCRFREECSTDVRGRTIERTPYDDSIERQRDKQKDVSKQELLKQRMKIVEPIFGYIKHNNHFNRWLYRGMENVQAQWNLICTTVNLKKIYKEWKRKNVVLC